MTAGGSTRSTLATRIAPVGAALLYLVLGAAYLEAVPPWEVPDEPLHARYVASLARGRLPDEDETWEALHPPGYYLLSAWVTSLLLPVDDDCESFVDLVPKPTGNPRMPFATAATWHVPDDPVAPFLRLLRSMSSMVGVLVVALAWATARAACRGAAMRPALAALLVALLPQFLFISHGVTNDTLAAAVGATAVYVQVAWAAGRLGDVKAAAAMFVLAAAGLLTKVNILPVLAATVPIAGGLALARRRDRAGEHAAWGAAMVPASTAWGLAATAAVIWLTAPELAGRMIGALVWRASAVAPALALPSALADLLWRTLESLYGRLGWQTIDLPTAPLGVIVAAVAIVAALVSLRRASPATRRALLAAAIVVALALAAHVKSGMADPQAQGRLLFPALAAIALLVAQGVRAVVPPRARWWSVAAIAVWLGVVNVRATQVLLPSAFAAATGPAPRVDQRFVPDTRSTMWLGGPGRLRLWQQFDSRQPGLSRIEIATGGSGGSGELVITLEDDLGRELATRTIELSELPEDGWVGLDVEPIADSPYRDFRLVLEVLPADGDGWVEVFVTDGDPNPAGRIAWPGGAAVDTDLVMVTYSGADAPRVVP